MSIDDMDPEIREALKRELREELLKEFENKEQLKADARRKEQEEVNKAHADFVARMKQSSEPWVEVVCMEPTADGIKTELEWNDAFITYLKQQGVVGIDDDQIIQRYITSLLQDMGSVIDEESESPSEYI